ncbi:hypothetical protein ACJMK2_042377, partial [Sinanodonta woodiana]
MIMSKGSFFPAPVKRILSKWAFTLPVQGGLCPTPIKGFFPRGLLSYHSQADSVQRAFFPTPSQGYSVQGGFCPTPLKVILPKGAFALPFSKGFCPRGLLSYHSQADSVQRGFFSIPISR